MFPKFGYIVGMDHVCRKRGPCLSEKAPFMELFFGTIAVGKNNIYMYIYIYYIIYVRCATSRKRHHGQARSVVEQAGDLQSRELLARQWDEAAPCPGDDQ